MCLFIEPALVLADYVVRSISAPPETFRHNDGEWLCFALVISFKMFT